MFSRANFEKMRQKEFENNGKVFFSLLHFPFVMIVWLLYGLLNQHISYITF